MNYIDAENPKWYDSMDEFYADALIEMVEKSDLIDRDKKNRLVWIEKHRAQPAEWSKEEERHLYNAIEAVKYVYDISEGTNGFKCVEFLKSLRPHWKPSEQEKGALRTAIHILTEERNFPKAAAHLQNILDVFEGEESRKDWKPSEEQINALKVVARGFPTDDPDAIDSLLTDLQKLL